MPARPTANAKFSSRGGSPRRRVSSASAEAQNRYAFPNMLLSLVCSKRSAGLAAVGGRPMQGYAAHQSTNDTRRPSTLVALGVAQLREVPALRAAGVRRGHHPLGPEHIKRRAAAASALHCLWP